MPSNTETPAEQINYITTQFESLRGESRGIRARPGADRYPKSLQIDVNSFPDEQGSMEFTQEYGGGPNNSQHGFMFTRIAVLIHHAQVTDNDS